jgi:hypothetical protein
MIVVSFSWRNHLRRLLWVWFDGCSILWLLHLGLGLNILRSRWRLVAPLLNPLVSHRRPAPLFSHRRLASLVNHRRLASLVSHRRLVSLILLMHLVTDSYLLDDRWSLDFFNLLPHDEWFLLLWFEHHLFFLFCCQICLDIPEGTLEERKYLGVSGFWYFTLSFHWFEFLELLKRIYVLLHDLDFNC